MAALFVLIRILSSSLANVFQKKQIEAGAPVIFVLLATYFSVSLGFGFFLFRIPLGIDFRTLLPDVAIMTALGVTGNFLLLQSLSETELSVFGPINSLKPLFSLIFAAALVPEWPGLKMLPGILLLVAGSAVLTFAGKAGTANDGAGKIRIHRGVTLRLVSMLLISVEAVFLKRLVGVTGPFVTLGLWALAGLPFILTIWLFTRRNHWKADIERCKTRPLSLAGAALGYLLMQLATLLAFQRMHVSTALALFQLSSILSVFLGHHFFREKGLFIKLGASIIMAAGAAFILIWKP